MRSVASLSNISNQKLHSFENILILTQKFIQWLYFYKPILNLTYNKYDDMINENYYHLRICSRIAFS